MTAVDLILKHTFLLLFFVFREVVSSDYCIVDENRRVEYCTWSCCGSGSSQYCCLSPYTIVGIVFGAIAFICTIATIIFCLCQYKKQRGQVVSLPNAQRIFVINGQGGQGGQVQTTGYSPTYPLAPGYGPQYGGMHYPAAPPPYNSLTPKHSSMPPPYNPPSTVPPPPPPAYSPPPNPFAKAAAQASRT